jgi:hypothetical protein
VLNNDLAHVFTMARTKAAAIRESVQKLQDALAFEESEAKRLGIT